MIQFNQKFLHDTLKLLVQEITLVLNDLETSKNNFSAKLKEKLFITRV
jgi:hypothetical protein